MVQESQNPDLIVTGNGGMKQGTSYTAYGMRGFGGGMDVGLLALHLERGLVQQRRRGLSRLEARIAHRAHPVRQVQLQVVASKPDREPDSRVGYAPELARRIALPLSGVSLPHIKTCQRIKLFSGAAL
jgi:hypothetical protein